MPYPPDQIRSSCTSQSCDESYVPDGNVIKSQVRHKIHSAASFEFTCAQPAAQDRNLGPYHFLIIHIWITSLVYCRISR